MRIESNLFQSGRVVAFVFAHQDDEFAFFYLIEASCRAGMDVVCVFLTDGAASGTVDPLVRNAESVSVLGRLGVSAENIHFVGGKLKIPDGALYQCAERAYQGLLNLFQSRPPTTLYLPAWEGGHHDHDLAHAIGLLAARSTGIADVWQCPLYNGEGTRWQWFHLLRPLATAASVRKLRLSLREIVFQVGLSRRYRSQWKTWLVLRPAFVWVLMWRRMQVLAHCQMGADFTRPHAGPLYYERRFGVSFNDVKQSLDVLFAAHWRD